MFVIPKRVRKSRAVRCCRESLWLVVSSPIATGLGGCNLPKASDPKDVRYPCKMTSTLVVLVVSPVQAGKTLTSEQPPDILVKLCVHRPLQINASSGWGAEIHHPVGSDYWMHGEIRPYSPRDLSDNNFRKHIVDPQRDLGQTVEVWTVRGDLCI